jgi:hypothetical protein
VCFSAASDRSGQQIPICTWHSKQRDEVEGTPGFAGNVSVALGLALSPGSGQNRRADETRFQFETQAARFLTVEVKVASKRLAN